MNSRCSTNHSRITIQIKTHKTMMKRKTLQLLTGALLCQPLSAGELQAQEQDKERPNILFILSDDHTSQSWGIYGGILAPYVKNDNIKRLADAAAEVTPWPTRFPTRGDHAIDDSSHVGASTDVGRIVCKTGDEIFTRLSITICAIVLTICACRARFWACCELP